MANFQSEVHHHNLTTGDDNPNIPSLVAPPGILIFAKNVVS